MQTIFDKDYELTYSHIDWRGVARPDAYFDFMQDAATVHARLCHLDRDDIGALWVLSRMYVEFERPLSAYDVLRITTWCAGIKGPSWLRAFEFWSNGQPAGRAISSWVLLDAQTHRILRPSTVPAAAEYTCAARETLPMPAKLDVSGLPLHHTHPIVYSDLDINNHLNNVKIAALVCDSLDLNQTDFVRTMQINYTAETPAGLTLSLHADRSGQDFRVCGQAQDTVRFEAAGTLTGR